jgi:hypothetical protein
MRWYTRVVELSIKSILVHRLAKQMVMYDMNVKTRLFQRVFKVQSEKFITEAREVLHKLQLQDDEINRIVRGIPDQALSEIDIFRSRSEFTADGADQMTLECVLDTRAQQLIECRVGLQ